MVKIRLARTGGRDKLFYRIVALDESRKRDGKALDIIGYWKPSTKKIEIDKKKLKKWQDLGAIVTTAVAKLM